LIASRANSGGRRPWRWALGLLGIGLVGGIAVLTLPLWTVPIVRMAIGRRERDLSEPAQMKVVGEALALYCNSADRVLDSRLGIGWLPSELRRLEPSWVSVRREGASVSFGGGFHGSGYGLSPKSAGEWVMTFSSEDGWTDPQTVKISMDRRLSSDELVQTMKKNYGEYLAEPRSMDAQLHAQAAWLRFLLPFGSTDELRSAGRELVLRVPDHVGAHYLAGVVEGTLGSRAAAAADFIAWVKSSPGFRHDAILAHFLVSQGANAEAVAAARDSLGRPLVDPPQGQDLMWNYSALGATLVADILALDPDVALSLCDKIDREETEKSTRAYFGPTLAQLRRRAVARKAGPAQSVADAGATEVAPPLDYDREFFGR
jgi:hypothetical protein